MIRAAALAASLALAGCAGGAGPTPPLAVAVAAPPPGAQYLYGSAEAAVLSLQAYQGMLGEVRARLADRRAGAAGATASAILAREATLTDPRFAGCGDRPPAVVLDVDETALLNLGAAEGDARHPGRPFDPARWSRWEQSGAGAVAAVPGAIEAFAELRRDGVAIVLNSNRSAANAAGTEAALAAAGLGRFRHGDTLFLRGDADGLPGKDGRRAAIAERWCVLALVGDQLGDFSDRFAEERSVPARRTLAQSAPLAGLWGVRWFLLPNPVYGTGLAGGFDDVFPADRRWRDPAEPTPKEPN